MKQPLVFGLSAGSKLRSEQSVAGAGGKAGSFCRPQGLGSLCCLWGPPRWHCDISESERGSSGNGGGGGCHSLSLPQPGGSQPSGAGRLGSRFCSFIRHHTHFRERRASVRAKGNGLFPRAQAPPPASCFWELRVLKCEAPRQGVGNGVGLVTWGICPCSASYLLCGSGQVTRPP